MANTLGTRTGKMSNHEAGSSGKRKRETSLDTAFSCAICYEVLVDPVSLPCGHSYDLGCLDTLTQSNDQRKLRCPLCRAKIVKPLPKVRARKTPCARAALPRSAKL